MHSVKSVQIMEVGENEPELKARGHSFTDWFVVGLGIARDEMLAADIVAGIFSRLWDNSVA